MAVTHKLIQTVSVTAGAGQASIEFTSIPQTYTDLLLLVSFRTSYAAVSDDMSLFFNNVTTNRTARFVYGTGSSALSTVVNDDGAFVVSDTATANVFGNGSIYIANYTSANFKPFSTDFVGENNATTAYQTFLTVEFSNSIHQHPCTGLVRVRI